MAEPFQLSDMSSATRGRVINWAAERVSIPHDSPARDAAVMLLDLVAACTEVAQSSIDDHWLRTICMAALYGPEEDSAGEAPPERSCETPGCINPFGSHEGACYGRHPNIPGQLVSLPFGEAPEPEVKG